MRQMPEFWHTVQLKTSKVLAPIPLLSVALAMLGIGLAFEYSWWWLSFVAFFCLLPFGVRMPAIGVLALSCSGWIWWYLSDYHARYEQQVTFSVDGIFDAEGSILSFNGKTAQFQITGTPWIWLLTFSKYEGDPPEIGKKYRVCGETFPLREPCGPGIFDQARWGYTHHVVAYVQVRELNCLGEGSLKSRLIGYSTKCREWTSELFMRGANQEDESRQVMISAVLGDKSHTQQETLKAIRESGCMHVFAVSGMHVGLVALMLLLVFRIIRVHPIPARWCCIVLLTLYVFVTGMPASAVRALVMVVFLLMGFIFQRKSHPFNMLALAFMILILWDPLQLWQPGFQLSFAVYAAVVLTSTWLMKEKPALGPDAFIPVRFYNKREKIGVSLEKTLRGILVISIIAWFVSFPFTMNHFGTWTSYSPVTNILIFAVIPYLIGFAFLGIAFVWLPPVSSLFLTLSSYCASWLLGVANVIGNWPGSYFSLDSELAENEALIIPFGRGNWSMVISNPSLLINSGNESSVRFTLDPILRDKNDTPFGLITMTDSQSPEVGINELKKNYPDLINWGQVGNTPIICWQFSPNNQVRLPELPVPLETGIRQDQCRVLQWECQGRSVLIIGDSGFSSLARYEGELHADVLIIGYHQRDPIRDTEWIESTGARAVIFTNYQECPVPEGVTTYNINRNGTISLRAEENGMVVTPWKKGDSRTE